MRLTKQPPTGSRPLTGFVSDVVGGVTFALRSLRKSPGFTVTIALTLAISIGATTAMFSIVNGVLFAPLPFANADRLVWTVNRGTRPYDAMSPPDLADWGKLNDAFEEVGGWMPSQVGLVGGGEPIHVTAAEVTGNWFTMLGTRMSAGRGLSSDDAEPGRPKVTVLSYALWQRQFGGDPGIVGRGVLIDGTRYVVVGIAARNFTFPSDADIWRPAMWDSRWINARGNRFFRGPIALIKRGVSFDQARRKARLAAAQLRSAYPEAESGLDFDIQPLHEHQVGGSRRLVVVLFGAVGALLLIACANVGTLMLVRASHRTTEIGVRLALGAGAVRVATQLLVESLLLAGLGAGLGLALAESAVRTIVAQQIAAVPLLSNVSVDFRVLVFAVVTTLAAGIAFGLAPALQSSRTDIVQALKSGGRASSARKSSARARHALVALELTLVVPLLVGAVLLARSFNRLVHVDPGFRPDHVVAFDLALPKCGTAWMPDTTCVGVVGPRYMEPAETKVFADELLRRLRVLPGTRSAAIGFGVPFTPWAVNQGTLIIEGRAPPPADRPNVVEWKEASPGYFALLGIPVLRGREFTDADRCAPKPSQIWCDPSKDGDGHFVTVISAGAAKAYFAGENPIGKRLKNMGEIVGVVGDTKTQGLAGDPEPAVYVAFQQNPVYYMTVLIKSDASAASVMTEARAQVAAIDKALAIFNLRQMRDAVDASAAPARLAASMVSAFATCALLLAMIGIYGVVAYAVHGRQRELGIRIALGAQRGQVVRLVVHDGLVLVAIGTGVGVVASILGSRVVAGLLYDIAPTDVMTYVVAVVALSIVAVAAAWIPARRAARIDPLIAMRPE
ncbi:MAG TPA: ABC transporter permease [Gemmatimonadaceae bacterium]|nr:ABC transporter permease [Gemmatimonadaceae bacterium]